MTVKVYELLATPERWTQGHYARDANGNAVAIFDANACCWCLAGALLKCYAHDDAEYSAAYRKLAASEIPSIAFNDTSTHAEVLDLVTRLGI